jgi:hypothetical protein
MRNHPSLYERTDAIFQRYLREGLRIIYGTSKQLLADLTHAENQRQTMGENYTKALAKMRVQAAVLSNAAQIVARNPAYSVDSLRLENAMQEYRDANMEVLEAAEAIAMADLEIRDAKIALEGK